MIGEFNPNIVLLSFGVSFLGAYVAISACEQLRGIYLKYNQPKINVILPWLILIAVSIGGVAIWSMHFIGMAAMSLKHDNGSSVAIRFNIGVSIFSIVAAVLSVIAGVWVASKDKVFAKSKAEILEFFIESVSLEEMLALSEFQVLLLLATRQLHYLVLGGAIAGSGVVIMHYIGMAAMELDGHIHWNVGIVAASIVIAVVAASAAFWIFFRLLSIYPDSEFLRIASALVMGVAVCGMHYTGMVAADFDVDQSRTTELSWKAGSMTQEDALYPVVLSAMIVLWLLTMWVLADLRLKISKYRAHLQKISPNEKLSILLLTAESDEGEEIKEVSGNNHSHSNGRRDQPLKARNAVAPMPFNDDESPI